jgi:hypothetical protein
MTMLTKFSAAALAVAFVASAHVAHADPIADFRAGTAVHVRLATMDYGTGPRTNGNVRLAKRAGSLDFDLAARDVGLAIPVTLHFRGSVIGGQIVYTIDDRFSPAVDVGNKQRLSRVTGRFVVAASLIPGAQNQRDGSVRLLSVDGSGYLDAFGDWGTRRIALTELDLIGGVPRPLTSFTNSGGRVCSDRVRTKHMLSVTLAAEAATSTIVDLASWPRGGVLLPSVVLVPAHRRSAPVEAFIDPDFVGTVHLTAASGGVTRSLELVVHPHRDCQ